MYWNSVHNYTREQKPDERKDNPTFELRPSFIQKDSDLEVVDLLIRDYIVRSTQFVYSVRVTYKRLVYLLHRLL